MRSKRRCAAWLALSAMAGCTYAPSEDQQEAGACVPATLVAGDCQDLWGSGSTESQALAVADAECDDGPCCSDGRYLVAGTVCDASIESDYSCSSDACGASAMVRTRDQLCTGSSALCDGALTEWSRALVSDECAAGEVCVPGEAACVACEDGDVCMDGVCQQPCECSIGPCCDGCYWMPTGTVCGESDTTEVGCPWGQGCGSDVGFRTQDRMCSGESAECDGELTEWSSWDVDAECDAGTACGGDEPGCRYEAMCNCDLDVETAPAWPAFTDPEGFFEVRARAEVDDGVVRVELHRGNDAAFGVAGRMLVYGTAEGPDEGMDGPSAGAGVMGTAMTLIASVDYLAGSSEVHLYLDVADTLGIDGERGLVVMSEPQGHECPSGAGCHVAMRNYGVQACGGTSSLCLRQACAGE